jgi:hypothetical protein
MSPGTRVIAVIFWVLAFVTMLVRRVAHPFRIHSHPTPQNIGCPILRVLCEGWELPNST